MICPECGEALGPGPLDTRRAACCGGRKEGLGHWLAAVLHGRSARRGRPTDR